MTLHLFVKKILLATSCLLVLSVQAQQVNKPTLMLPIGHTGGVYEAIYSPNYKFILTRDRFETPRVWDAQTGYLLANLKGHNGRVYRMGYSNDGAMFFTGGSRDGTIFIWQTKTATKLFTFQAKGETVESGAFSLDGARFIAAGSDIRIWDLKTGKLLLVFNPRKKDDNTSYSINKAAFNRAGNIAFAYYNEGQGNNNRYFFDTQTGSILAITTLNEETNQFELKESFVKDTSFLDITSSLWKYPLRFPLQDKGLEYGLDSNSLWITDSSMQKKQFVIAAHTDMARLFYFLPDSTLVAEPLDKLYAGIWDTKTMQMKSTIYFEGIPRPVLNNGKSDGNIIFNNTRSIGIRLVDNNFWVYDMAKQKRLEQFSQNRFPKKVQNAFFSNNDSLLITINYEGKESATVWQTSTGKPIRIFSFDDSDVDYITYACFSNDNKWIALFGKKTSVKIYEMETGRLIKTLNKGPNEKFADVFGGGFSPDKTMLFYLDNDAKFKVFNINAGNVIYAKEKEPGNYVAAAIFTLDSKKIILGTSAGINKVVDLQTKKMEYHFFQIDSTDYFTQTPDGYYQASQGATKLLHYVTNDLKVITFDQLDIKYNRPDKVLETLGSADAGLINSYHRAWEKRMKKLGIDTTQFKEDYSVPEMDFTNRDAMQLNNVNGKLPLRIKGSDGFYKLDRFNVWVNEVPLFGLKGISIKSRNKSSFDTTLTIALSQGENRIETSIINANGTESYRMPLFAKYAPSSPKKTKRHFIGFGINQFANPEYNLSWSVKDIRDLALKLSSKYPEIIIDTLFDANLTKENMLALKTKLLLLNEDDIVMVSYSGHGVLSKEFDYYLSTYPINFNNPEDKGLAYDDLESLLDNIKPRQKLMLIDACHSGEVDKDEIAKIESAKKSLSKNGIATKSTIKVVPKKNIGMVNSFELMQKLFVNVGKGTGSTIISAAGGMQYAQERGDLKNGVFTYSILEAFNNNLTLKVSALKRQVGNRVLQLTNGLQKPTSRNETNNYDWIIW
jgi:WD40 repeat protein